jgi:hypothetical protein
MREVYEQMRTGPYADQVLGSRPAFRDLVFLSATRAAVHYESEVPGYPPRAFGQQFGEVRPARSAIWHVRGTATR